MIRVECHYWAMGRGCKRDHVTPNCCRKGYHDPSKRKFNLCHRFARGTCSFGDGCKRLHELDEPSTAPGSSSSSEELNARKATIDYLVRSLLAQMQQDIIEGLNTRQKFMTFYAAKLHPDKWSNWDEMTCIMTEVFKQLKNKEAYYLAGNIA